MKTFFNIILILIIFIVISSCGKSSSGADSFKGSGTTGLGGSMARFTITNNHLYTVSDSKLSIFDVRDANEPILRNKVDIGLGVETIFPLADNIFIGTQTGMKIMDVSQPTDPVMLSSFQHIRSCDPVVANGKYAYVTLRSDNLCTRGTNELQVLDISNLQNPVLLTIFPMTKPSGLALDGNNLFVCDNVLKWYDVTDPKKIVSKGSFVTNATDLFVHNNILMVIGTGGLSQYSYASGEIKLLSRIPTTL